MPPVHLIFIISAPRSGSTLLQRMLASHPQIFSHPEPHLITPLNYLGYHATVEKAPYDYVNSAAAMQQFIDDLPRGEADYLDALRAYTDTLYSRALKPAGKTFFLDKTPAYALILPFLVKLYPDAKFIVLCRHPLAIFHSVAHSFFGGDYQQAQRASPVLEKYVPAIGDFILQHPVPFIRVSYEELVGQPETTMRRLCASLGVPYAHETIAYGDHPHTTKSFGDPVTVHKYKRPVQHFVNTWAQDLNARPDAMALAHTALAQLDDAHLQAWGYPRKDLFASCASTSAVATRRARLDSYQLKRQALLLVRRHLGNKTAASALRQVRYFCDVLLRTS